MNAIGNKLSFEAAEARATRACELYKLGKTRQEISSELGISDYAISRYLTRMGILKNRVIDSPDFVSLKRLQKIVGSSLYTIKETAEVLGIKAIKIGKCLCFPADTPKKILSYFESQDSPEFRDIDQTYCAWVGGLFDGEGHIGIHFGKSKVTRSGLSYSIHWEVVNTDKEIMDRAAFVLDLLGIHYCLATRQKTITRKPIWRLIVSPHRDLAMACKAIGPHCTGIKRKKMELVYDLAMSLIALGRHRGDKFAMVAACASKFKELK